MSIRDIAAKAYRSYRTQRLKKSVINAHHDVSDVSGKIYDARKYGFSLAESRIYEFPKNDYHDYITTWEAYQPRLDDGKYFIISDDKLLFSLVFGKVIEVPEIYAVIKNGEIHSISGSKVSRDNLYNFLLEHDGGIIKDRSGSDGFGVLVFKKDGGSLKLNEEAIDRSALLQKTAVLKDAIIQKRLVQGEFENSIYDRTINTIRIISVQKKGSFEHEIIGAVQRIGTSRSFPVDNFNQGGGSALIDLESGELSSMSCIDSFDESGNRIFFDKHPDSGAQIKGRVIPRWDEIKKTIAEVSAELPLFRYIAWDIVLKDDGIALIETNMKSSLNVFQIHGGMRGTLLGEKYRECGYIKS